MAKNSNDNDFSFFRAVISVLYFLAFIAIIYFAVNFIGFILTHELNDNGGITYEQETNYKSI